MYQGIPQTIKEIDQWVCACDDMKVPFKAYERGAASVSNPNTWSFYEQAEWAVNEGHYDHIGWVFNNNGIVGIDMDDAFDEYGLLTSKCADIINHCRSYTERSKSGSGIHILVKGRLPWDGKNNRDGVEIYQSGRFFILTGRVLKYTDICENQEAIDYVLSTYFSDTHISSSGGFYDKSDKIYKPVYKVPQKGKISLRPIYPPIPSGCRNMSLASLAGSMWTTGYSVAQIYAELEKVNSTACEHPVDNRELRAIVESICKYDR